MRFMFLIPTRHLIFIHLHNLYVAIGWYRTFNDTKKI